MRYVEDYLTQNNRIYFYLTPIWGIYRICLINIYVIHVIRQLCEFCVKLRRFHRFARDIFLWDFVWARKRGDKKRLDLVEISRRLVKILRRLVQTRSNLFL